VVSGSVLLASSFFRALFVDDWSVSCRSLALQVPSALCPLDGNVIINPEHGDFRRLVIGMQFPISLDERLRKDAS